LRLALTSTDLCEYLILPFSENDGLETELIHTGQESNANKATGKTFAAAKKPSNYIPMYGIFQTCKKKAMLQTGKYVKLVDRDGKCKRSISDFAIPRSKAVSSVVQ